MWREPKRSEGRYLNLTQLRDTWQIYAGFQISTFYARDHLSEMVALDKLTLPEQSREDRKRSCVNTRKRLRGCSTIPYQYRTIPNFR